MKLTRLCDCEYRELRQLCSGKHRNVLCLVNNYLSVNWLEIAAPVETCRRENAKCAVWNVAMIDDCRLWLSWDSPMKLARWLISAFDLVDVSSSSKATPLCWKTRWGLLTLMWSPLNILMHFITNYVVFDSLYFVTSNCFYSCCVWWCQ